MAKALRVHNLAKELGVASKEIIAKCNAEGIELKNHMATISLGLAESIREWFSSGADVTSIEVAPQVDLDKVRKAPPTKTDSVEDEAAGEDSAVAVETQESEAEIEATVTPTVEAAEAPTAEEAPIEAAAAEEEEAATPTLEAPTPEVVAASEVATPSETPPVAVEIASEAEAPEFAVPSENIEQLAAKAPETAAESPEAPPKPPKVIRPAGPQVVPTPATLQGPRLVRIERPEVVRTPRPRPSGGPPSVGGAGGGGAGGPSTPTTPAQRGGRGRREQEEEDRKKARAGTRRQPRGADVGEKLREWRDQDLIERRERLASATGQGLKSRRAAERRRQSTPQGRSSAAARGEVQIVAPISLKEYCSAIGVPFAQVMRRVMDHTGQLVTITQTIEGDVAEMVAMDFGVTLRVEQAKTELEKLQDETAARERLHLEPRPPVVAMLGHVDHGKTSLLDRIRNTDVASGEAGGITQHIGASRIQGPDGPVTFLDTPGHEAFTAMRARGAHMTDVVVLVVAADDGVMPQTAEAINHAKAAGVQIVVALNKIDLPGVDLNKIYGQLAEHELVPSEWGGTTDVIKTSATTGEGVAELVAHLSTLSELMELQADSTVPAVAMVIEAEMKGGQGAVARVLVQEGTLKTGDIVVCGPGFGRVRSLLDPRGKRVNEATPGTPVGVVGLDELPDAGDRLYVVSDNSRAKSIAEEVRQQRRQKSLRTAPRAMGLEELLAGATAEEVPVLSVIVKADTQGSVETLRAQLGDFPADKVQLRILHAGVGAVTEADVALAQASQAIIIGFHVSADDRARQAADVVGVEIRTYRVIYEILEDVHKALEGLLEPLRQEEARGVVEVRQIFNVGRIGTIAGCYVVDGLVNRNHRVRLVREGRIIREDAGIESLRRFKDDVREVKNGFECGIKLERFDDLKPGDRMEIYEIVEVSAKL